MTSRYVIMLGKIMVSTSWKPIQYMNIMCHNNPGMDSREMGLRMTSDHNHQIIAKEVEGMAVDHIQ